MAYSLQAGKQDHEDEYIKLPINGNNRTDIKAIRWPRRDIGPLA